MEIELPEPFKSDACRALVTDLTEFIKAAQRIIVAPRINMETPVALTAWRRILKLEKVDKESIEKFIEAYHNRGPEQTVE